MKKGFYVILVLFCMPCVTWGGFMNSRLLVETRIPTFTEILDEHSFEITVTDQVELKDIKLYGFDIDVNDSAIIFCGFAEATNGHIIQFSEDWWKENPYHGFSFYDINGTIPSIAFVSISSDTVMEGLDASRIMYDDENIYINFAGLYATADTYVRLNVEFIPEPASLLLLGLGGVLACRRKRSLLSK